MLLRESGDTPSGPEGQQSSVVGRGNGTAGTTPRMKLSAEEAHPQGIARSTAKFLQSGWDAGQTKRPSGQSRRAFVLLHQYGISSE